MELINKQYALASAISGIVITDENGEKWIRTRDVRESIMNVPIIEAEPIKHGRWIDKEDPYGFFDTIPVCSECGCTTKMREKYRYCPNCGVRMDGGENG